MPDAVDLHRVHRDAGRRQGLATGPAQQVRGHRLDLLGRVGERKDDGPLDVLRHFPHDLPGEGTAYGRGADQYGRAHVPYDRQQIDAVPSRIVGAPVLDLFFGPGVTPLIVAQPVHAVEQQPRPVDEPDAAGRFGVLQAVADHGLAELVGDADAGCPGPEHHDALLAERHAGDVERGPDGGERDGAGALHVVVEHAVALAVPLQEAPRVARAEVLEVQERVRVQRRDRVQVRGDEGVVAFAARPAVPYAEVQRIVEQRLVVRTDVQDHRQAARGIDARGRRVHGQFAHRDLDSVHAPVADAEDLLGVGDDDQVHLVRREIQFLEGAAQVLGPVDGEEDAARAPVLMAVRLDRLAHGRVVDDRQQLGEVIGEQPVVKDLVAVVQLLQMNVRGQIVGLAAQLLVRAPRLLVQREHRVGQSADEAEAVAFGGGEGGSAVGQRIVHDPREPRLSAHPSALPGARLPSARPVPRAPAVCPCPASLTREPRSRIRWIRERGSDLCVERVRLSPRGGD